MNRTTRPLATVAALFAILSAGLLAGCHMIGPEKRGWWFCDASGCYLCTPYGCDGLPDMPPSPSCTAGAPCSCVESGACLPHQNPTSTCSTSAQCRAGYICTKGACVPGKPGPCSSDEACGAGAFCNAGTCEDTGLCQSGAQCTQFGPGYGCDGRGTCALQPAPPPTVPSCTSADSCTGGICASNACGSCPGGDCGGAVTCLLDRHCGAGRACLDGHCAARCEGTGASSCGTGQICKAGVCAPDGKSCTADAECGGAGAVCVNNRCHATCTATGACDNPLDVCSGAIQTASFSVRICRADDAAKLECRVSKDCSGGETCVNGVCRTACSKVEDCAACDDGPVCGPGGFCMTALEADPQCTAAAPCSGGLACLGGQCQAL